ncbi:MAG: serine/threonine-protein kinase [Myxococcales bacterium]
MTHHLQALGPPAPPLADPRGHEPTRPSAIGRYLVLNLVGKGAMGEVYAAYDPELERKVAIKLLRGKAGDSAEASEGRTRMMREAQAIAKLSHPNVVVVYDVGAFQDQVFVAMEFVDGHTLWYWMHAQPRSWTDVLKIFADAGRGLAAAHQKDLVHRDFKPENVMIGSDGQVRVMDFGLARTVGTPRTAAAPVVNAPPALPTGPANESVCGDSEDLMSTRQIAAPDPAVILARSSQDGENVSLTRTGAIVGTPAYMSPEQFRGLDTDQRTDQFSFCVALYEALYGQRPFAGNTHQALETNVINGRIKDAPVPCDVPPWVRKVLLRGLRPDPEERWPSMQALLAELEKNRIFARRRRFADDASAKLNDVWQAPVRGRVVETPARKEMRAAFLATGKRYAASTFETVSGTLDRYAKSWLDMYVDICQATHVRGEQSADVMDLRMACLMDLRERLRALCLIFRQADSEVVENAVSAANALGNVARCADLEFLRLAVKPPEDQATREAVSRLRSRLAEVRVLGQVGRLNDGLQAVAPLEAEIRAIGYGPLLAELLLESGQLHSERRDAEAAAQALEEAVWTAELCRHDEVAAAAATSLVFVMGNTQLRFDAAEIWARLAETILRRVGGHETLWGWLLNNRGAMRQKQGRMDEGLADMVRAVAAKEKAGGADSPDVAQSLGNIGMFLAQTDKAEEALSYFARTLALMDRALGADHPRGAFMQSNYAEVLNDVGRFAEAREMSSRALATVEREMGADDLPFTYPLSAFGVACLGEGRTDEAVRALERVVALCDAKETEPGRLGEVHFALARALMAAGTDPRRARRLAEQARDEYSRAPKTPLVKRELARLEKLLGDPAGQFGQLDQGGQVVQVIVGAPPTSG